MHAHRLARLVIVLAAASALTLPGAAVAAEPSPAAPPAAVATWQDHLAHMQAMPGPFGDHVGDCIALLGSLGGQPGPNGPMGAMMGGLVP